MDDEDISSIWKLPEEAKEWKPGLLRSHGAGGMYCNTVSLIIARETRVEEVKGHGNSEIETKKSFRSRCRVLDTSLCFLSITSTEELFASTSTLKS